MVHVKGHMRNGHWVRDYERSAPSGSGGGGASTIAGIFGTVVVGILVIAAITGGSSSAKPWSRAGYRFTTKDSAQSSSCAGPYSYGKVGTYLDGHACTGLQRSVFAATSPDGKPMTVAVETVTMPSTSEAEHLQDLVDQPGTGNVTELGGGRFTFTGKHYDSRLDGTHVRIAEAEAKPGKTVPAAVLDKAATTALDAPTQ